MQWFEKMYQSALESDNVMVPIKYIKLWRKFDDASTDLLLKYSEGLTDIVIVILLYAEIKDRIQTLYYTPYAEKLLLVNRNAYYWTLADCIDNVKSDYDEALERYGTLYVECNFPDPSERLMVLLHEFVKDVMLTNSLAISHGLCDDHIVFQLDDTEYRFAMYLDIFQDYRLHVLPEGL